MRASAIPVEGSKVRLSVEVEESEIDRVLEEAVRETSRQARVPGFRPGKVPRQVLEARMGGAAAMRAGALREAISDFYARAVNDTDVDPIAPPEIDITAGEERGPLSFDALVQVRPTVAIPGYAGLTVTVPSPAVTDSEVDAQIDRMRDTEAELVEVDRPVVDGDHVTVNLAGTGAAGEDVVSVDDYLYEVGSGKVLPELDGQLRGAKVGDVLSFSASPPGSPDEVAFRVLVKDVKEKKLPPLVDSWAAESSEFSTVAELRANLETRIAKVKVAQAEHVLREGALAALVELVDDDEVPDSMVDDEVRQRVHDLSHRLEEQRIDIDQFLKVTGRTGDELVAEVRVDAHRSVKADLALRALAGAEGLEVTDEELETEIATMATRMDIKPDVLRDQIDRAGSIVAVRSEKRKAMALDWLIEHVRVVDEDGKPMSREELGVSRVAGPAARDTAGTGGTGQVTRVDVPGAGAATGQEEAGTG